MVHSRLSIVVVTVNSDDCKNVSSISFFQDLFLLLHTQGSNHFSDTAKLRAGTKKATDECKVPHGACSTRCLEERSSAI